MRVKCIRSFVGKAPDGRTYSPSMGDEFELPDGTDWLQAGFVEPLKEQKETATQAKPKTRSKRTSRSKSSASKSE